MNRSRLRQDFVEVNPESLSEEGRNLSATRGSHLIQRVVLLRVEATKKRQL
jgi:hypothetical protein